MVFTWHGIFMASFCRKDSIAVYIHSIHWAWSVWGMDMGRYYESNESTLYRRSASMTWYQVSVFLIFVSKITWCEVTGLSSMSFSVICNLGRNSLRSDVAPSSQPSTSSQIFTHCLSSIQNLNITNSNGPKHTKWSNVKRGNSFAMHSSIFLSPLLEQLSTPSQIESPGAPVMNLQQLALSCRTLLQESTTTSQR